MEEMLYSFDKGQTQFIADTLADWLQLRQRKQTGMAFSIRYIQQIINVTESFAQFMKRGEGLSGHGVVRFDDIEAWVLDAHEKLRLFETVRYAPTHIPEVARETFGEDGSKGFSITRQEMVYLCLVMMHMDGVYDAACKVAKLNGRPIPYADVYKDCCKALNKYLKPEEAIP